MIRHADLWKDLPAVMAEPYKIAFPEFLEKLAVKANHLSILDAGSPPPFIVLQTMLPHMSTDFTWEVLLSNSCATDTALEELQSFLKKSGIEYSSHHANASLTVYHGGVTGQILFSYYKQLQDLINGGFSRFDMITGNYKLADLNSDMLDPFLAACRNHHLSFYFGPLYDGIISWQPGSTHDGRILSMFNQILTYREGLSFPNYVRHWASRHNYALKEVELQLSIKKTHQPFLRQLTYKQAEAAQGKMPGDELEAWRSQKLYKIEAGRQAALVGFKFFAGSYIKG